VVLSSKLYQKIIPELTEILVVSLHCWFIATGIKQGTFRSACLPDGYSGTWKHGGHEHTLKSVFVCDL